ncbi:hypothetical protein Ct61P_01124 [Colletotrichum tofieldiae]|nr:hypothetical protein Ct61P_01124 [Colletotrichum tofieldiae]
MASSSSATSSSIDITGCNQQLESPLFSVLPGEIRNEIFALALIQYEDFESAYPEDSYWYRPGFKGRGRAAAPSSRRASWHRGPEGRTGNDNCELFFLDLTPQQSRDLQRPQFRPETLTVTVRYSDWWFWETDEPLRMAEDWLRGFRGPTGLRELRVEYETLAAKRDEMMSIVERNKRWKLAVGKRREGATTRRRRRAGT